MKVSPPFNLQEVLIANVHKLYACRPVPDLVQWRAAVDSTNHFFIICFFLFCTKDESKYEPLHTLGLDTARKLMARLAGDAGRAHGAERAETAICCHEPQPDL